MLYNVKVLNYKDSTHIEFFNRPIKRTQSENANTITDDIEKEKRKIRILEDLDEDIRNEHSVKTSVNRSKNNLYKIARSNKWDWFITITFDRNITDASNYDEVVGRLTTWLNNQRKRGSPDLKYLIVPEFHKDGINYHFHGLVANCEGFGLKYSGHNDVFGNEIYNITNWCIGKDKKPLGHTTATRIKDNGKVTNYIGKYITKDMMNKLKYKKRYYASRNCEVAEEEYLNIQPDDFYKMFGVEFDYLKTKDIPEAGQRIRYIEINKIDKDVR